VAKNKSDKVAKRLHKSSKKADSPVRQRAAHRASAQVEQPSKIFNKDKY
jgi:hypothetical protein